MLDAEASVRTLHAYAGILQSRLALARATGSRQEFNGVAEHELAQVRELCVRAIDGIDNVLGRMSPELASHVAAIADLSVRRELDRSPDRRPPLRLVGAVASGTA